MSWLNFFGDLLGSAINAGSNVFNNWASKGIADATNAQNMQMNRENIAFQQAENDITRFREDNAVQRRASDLAAAGLSKTLAAGQSASANSLNAPNNSIPMQRYERKAFQLQNAQLGTAFLENKVREKQLELEEKETDAKIKNIESSTELNGANLVLTTIQQDLTTKQMEILGWPDWAVVGYNVLGAAEFNKLVSKLGEGAKAIIDRFLDNDNDGSSVPNSPTADALPRDVESTMKLDNKLNEKFLDDVSRETNQDIGDIDYHKEADYVVESTWNSIFHDFDKSLYEVDSFGDIVPSKKGRLYLLDVAKEQGISYNDAKALFFKFLLYRKNKGIFD